METWFFSIPLDLVGSNVLPLLSVPDIVHLDSACCSRSYRSHWATVLTRAGSVDINNALRHATYEQRRKGTDPAVIWLVNRGVRVRNAVIGSPAKWKVVLAHPNMFESIKASGSLPSTILQSSGPVARQITKWKDGGESVQAEDIASLTGLQSIDMWYTSDSKEAIHNLMSNNPGLTDLELTCLSALKPPFLSVLETIGPALLRLSLHVVMPTLRISDFENIGRCCPALRAFELSTTGEEDVWDPLDAWLLPIAQGCTELRDLHLTGTVSAETIGRFVQNCTKLHTLRMWGSDVDDAILLALASAAADTSEPSLRVLEVTWAVWRTETVQQSVPFLHWLESLALPATDVIYMKTLTEAVLHLDNVRSLTIYMGYEQLPGSLVAGIAQGCPALRDLALSHGISYSAHLALTEVFAKCVHLETVSLGDATVSDATLCALAADGAGRKLRRLNCGTTGVTDVGLTALAVSCGSHLQEVSIYEGGALTDVALKAFSVHCPALQSLLLPKATAKITVEGVKELFSACPRLRCVTVGAASLTQRQVYETLNRAQLPGRRKVIFAANSYTGGTG